MEVPSLRCRHGEGDQGCRRRQGFGRHRDHGLRRGEAATRRQGKAEARKSRSAEIREARGAQGRSAETRRRRLRLPRRLGDGCGLLQGPCLAVGARLCAPRRGGPEQGERVGPQGPHPARGRGKGAEIAGRRLRRPAAVPRRAAWASRRFRPWISRSSGPSKKSRCRRIKKLSGPALHRSWLNIPHVTHNEEADITTSTSTARNWTPPPRKRATASRCCPSSSRPASRAEEALGVQQLDPSRRRQADPQGFLQHRLCGGHAQRPDGAGHQGRRPQGASWRSARSCRSCRRRPATAR